MCSLQKRPLLSLSPQANTILHTISALPPLTLSIGDAFCAQEENGMGESQVEMARTSSVPQGDLRPCWELLMESRPPLCIAA